MCLSPEIDVITATSIAAVSISALRQNVDRRTFPIALIPAIFSVHLFASAIVWLGFDGIFSSTTQNVAITIYLLIAFVLWPTYIPLAIWFIEPSGWRRKILLLSVIAGLLTSAQFFHAIAIGHGSVTEGKFFIDFHVNETPTSAGIAYFIITCGSALISGQRAIVMWGGINVIVVYGLVVSANHGLPSLWCFWAAVTSVCVLLFIKDVKSRHIDGAPWPWVDSSDSAHKVDS